MPNIPLTEGTPAFRGCTGAVLPNTTVTIGVSSYAPAIYTPVAPGVVEWSVTFDDPHTWTRPKPLVSVAGKPMLEHVIDRVRDAGNVVTHIVLKNS